MDRMGIIEEEDQMADAINFPSQKKKEPNRFSLYFLTQNRKVRKKKKKKEMDKNLEIRWI
jgi:hypothetical protein